jgi:hypothetical protein
MNDDMLRDFAGTLAIRGAHIRADNDPDDAVVLMADMLHEAKRDPAGWLAANRPKSYARPAQPKRAAPDADEVYRRRREQVGGGR